MYGTQFFSVFSLLVAVTCASLHDVQEDITSSLLLKLMSVRVRRSTEAFIDFCGLKKEIHSYAPTVHKIIQTATNELFEGVTWRDMAEFIDRFGPRISGSEALEKSIDYMMRLSSSVGFDNVHGENVSVPHWVRGNESATLIEPRRKNLQIFSLGFSVGTSPEGITAEALVVKSIDELKQKRDLARGKIVVFNQEFVTYRSSRSYRDTGPTTAEEFGAVATLIRSITPESLSTPHTGAMLHSRPTIPTACITAEDAQMLQRMQDSAQKIKINLKMEAQTLPEKISRNLIFEIKGTEYPEKVLIMSAHIDSWDVGDGAQDDAGGLFVVWEAMALLRGLKLKPRRTIRGILWTAEEFGLVGAKAYAKRHKDEIDNIIMLMESDAGTFHPVGVEYAGNHEGGFILNNIMKLLKPIGATNVRNSESVGSDISIWMPEGIPGISLDTKNDKYFWYHHSSADTMDKMDSRALDKNVALVASVMYILADLSVDFPKDKIHRKKSH